MTKLTEAQTHILIAAASAEDGSTTAPDAAKSTIIGLVRRGLITSELEEDGPARLIITEAGRAALPADAPSSVAEPPMAEEEPKPPTKLQRVVMLLRREEGASLGELMDETGWQAHSVRGALSGAVKKGLGLEVVSEKTETGRRYRIPAKDAEA